MNRFKTGLDYCVMDKTSTQSFATATDTVVTWDRALSDQGGITSIANDWIEFVTSGLYLVRAQVHWDGDAATAAYYRYLTVHIDTGAGFSLFSAYSVVRSTISDVDSIHGATFLTNRNVGDRIRVHVAQQSGSTDIVNTGQNTFFSAYLLPNKLL